MQLKLAGSAPPADIAVSTRAYDKAFGDSLLFDGAQLAVLPRISGHRDKDLVRRVTVR